MTADFRDAGSVSYTHLDVYKRQAMDGGNGAFYTVVYKALESEEAKYKAQVEGILKSFRLAP